MSIRLPDIPVVVAAHGGERRDAGADSGRPGEGSGAQQQVHRPTDRQQVAAGVGK